MEKRYKHQLRLDVSKCFESIYTHSIAWAVYGKQVVKDNYQPGQPRTFPERFDQLLQRLNYNETNGILVGSEFARLFAEIVLQAIDFAALRSLEKRGLVRGVHYEILRYVDDYFVFFDRVQDELALKEVLKLELKEYGLSLNRDKQSLAFNPDITPISVAKSRLSEFLGQQLGKEAATGLSSPGMLTAGKNSTRLITTYKTIIKETGVDPSDVLNYALSIIEKQVAEGLVSFAGSGPRREDFDELVLALTAVTEFAFFIYAASPKVNPTVKLCRVVSSITSYVNNTPMAPSARSATLDAIFFEIRAQLQKAHSEDRIQVEKLYLLSCLVPLGREYLFSEEEIANMFAIDLGALPPSQFGIDLDHFSMSTLLHYLQDRTRYARLRTAVEAGWIRRIGTLRLPAAERLFLILDGASSPHISLKGRLRILDAGGLVRKRDRYLVMRHKPAWFIKWRRFDLADELELKRNQEVY